MHARARGGGSFKTRSGGGIHGAAWAEAGTHGEVVREVAASPGTVRVGSSTGPDAQVIRVLSINCCLLPTGLRNRRLTLDGTVGGFGSAIVLWAALSYGLCAALWPRLAVWLRGCQGSLVVQLPYNMT